MSRLCMLAGLVLVLVAALAVFWTRPPRLDAPTGGPPTEVGESSSELADSGPGQNLLPATSLTGRTTLSKRYAGTAACAGCHRDRYESYLQTAHSRSLRRVDLRQVQTGVTMDHALSKRSYEIIDRQGQLMHREWEHFVARGEPLSDGDPKVMLAELPVEFVMGSGAYAEAFLLRDRNFLMQSPVTWYQAESEYAMAPGYDAKSHRGCNRVIESNCLFCHAGQISQEQPQSPQITELAIGCERCHGPSETHAAYHKLREGRAEEPENASETPSEARSVNPAVLDRTRLESICAQCHLNGDVVVVADGRDLWDFVPGEQIAATRLAYRAEDGDKNDPFAQHFDQMWQSECYKQSETLTCVSCHDPHHGKPTKDLAGYYRDKCISCHGDEACGLPTDRRTPEHANRCIQCHMPASPSKAVHAATTDHRIGIHSASTRIENRPANASVTLRRIQPPPSGMAAGQLETADRLAEAYWLLEHVDAPQKTRGLDAASLEHSLRSSVQPLSSKVLAVLARLASLQADNSQTEQETRGHIDRAAQDALRALRDPTIDTESRVSVLEVLGKTQSETGDYAASAQTYEQLVTHRRSAIDFYNLGISLAKSQQVGRAEQAFRESIRIDPSYALPYRSLSVLYRAVDPDASERMMNMAKSLIQNEQ